MNRADIERAADGIADTLASIERGTLESTPTQTAYLTGAHEAFQAALGKVEWRSTQPD